MNPCVNSIYVSLASTVERAYCFWFVASVHSKKHHPLLEKPPQTPPPWHAKAAFFAQWKGSRFRRLDSGGSRREEELTEIAGGCSLGCHAGDSLLSTITKAYSAYRMQRWARFRRHSDGLFTGGRLLAARRRVSPRILKRISSLPSACVCALVTGTQCRNVWCDNRIERRQALLSLSAV